MSKDIISELAPSGTLRVGINLGNSLLVTGSTPTGEPTGVAPSMGRAIADRLGIPVTYVTFASPGEVADAAVKDEWDIGLIADDPKRAETMAFPQAYVEIEATYLVPENSSFQSMEDVDSPGTQIAISGRSAYDLFLARTLEHAELHRGQGLQAAFELYVSEKLDALAGLRPALNDNAEQLGNARVLDGCFLSVQQAIGTKPGKPLALAFLQEFMATAKENGLIASLIEQHGVKGRLQVAKILTP